jgi:hypothetical protein
MKKERGLKDYWELIDVPVVIFILYMAITLAFPLNNFLGDALAAIISIAVMLAVFGFIGFKIFREGDEHPGKAGAYAGAIVGLASAVLSIIAFYLFPSVFAQAIQDAIRAGADAATVRTFMQIGLFAGLIINPAIYAGIGAVLTIAGKYAAKKFYKKK